MKRILTKGAGHAPTMKEYQREVACFVSAWGARVSEPESCTERGFNCALEGHGEGGRAQSASHLLITCSKLAMTADESASDELGIRMDMAQQESTHLFRDQGGVEYKRQNAERHDQTSVTVRKLQQG